MSTNLDETLRALQSKDGWSTALSLSEMLEGWRSFVEQCEEGYSWNIYEYENDISVRGRIALALTAAELREHPAIKEAADEVEQLDRRFQSVVQKDVAIHGDDSPWWRRSVLKFAGEEYVGDIKGLHGIEVELKS